MILGVFFLILFTALFVGFIIPAVFTIAIGLLLIYLIYRLIKWFDERALKQ